MQFEQLKSFVLNKLKTELPAHLCYHNVDHTIQVLEKSEQLAADENVNGEDLQLLKAAAVLHDTGFLEAYIGHEEVSCSIARTFLPQFEYNDRQINRICQLIMYTHLPQKPLDKTGEILCDADLYYLGTNEYTSFAESLYQEWLNVDLIKGRNDWTERQIKFLHSHHYFTNAAAKKLSNIQHQNLLILQTQEGKIKSVTGHKDFYFSDILLLLMGVITAGFALQGFLVPNNFFDGGMTGISLLLH
ncbi:MAG TPA: HD domain-containing protein, partial [Puia sp.]|nr:HD domain-containing protein [Puia sp.]